MKRKKILLFATAVLMFVFSFIIVIFSNNNLKETKGTDVKSTELKGQEQVNAKDGSIYYKELSVQYDIKEFYYSAGAYYGYSLLYYNGRIYTCDSLNMYSSNSKPDAKLLSKVYTHFDICWSEDTSMLASVTGDGDIYETSAYDEKDRICLCYKKRKPAGPAGILDPEEDKYHLQYFDCLNGIYLLNGKDLYKDKLHLEDTKKVYISKDYDGKRKKKIPVKDTIFNKFFEILYGSKFLQPDIIGSLGDDVLKEEESCVLELEDKHGIKTILKIYLSGYVISSSPEGQSFIIETGKDICNEIYAYL